MSAPAGTAWRYGVGIAVLVLLFDRLSKALLIDLLARTDWPLELTPFFNLVMVWNRGISFGLFQAEGAGRWLLIAVAAAITLALAVWLARAESRLTALAIGLVIGGAISNMIDRLWYDAKGVADFFDLHAFGWHWPAFNGADAAIVGGVALLMLDSIRCGEGERPASSRLKKRTDGGCEQ